MVNHRNMVADNVAEDKRLTCWSCFSVVPRWFEAPSKTMAVWSIGRGDE